MCDKAPNGEIRRRETGKDLVTDQQRMEMFDSLVMPGCGKFALRAAETGLDYEIFLYVPEAEPPEAGFPVIYVLDANSDFITVAETVRRVSRRPAATGIAPAIVVGIGYPNTNGYNIDRRHLDFTRGPADAHVFPEKGSDQCGGQPAYIRFLETQLMPLIEARGDVDRDCRVLLGHSLAGYFVLDLLAQRPDMFNGYISFSPSVWWDRAGLSASFASSCPLEHPFRFYSAVGRWEQALAPWQAPANFSEQYHEIRRVRRMIDNAREMADEIGRAFDGKAEVRFEVGEDEDHATIVTTSLCRALRFIGSGWPR